MSDDDITISAEALASLTDDVVKWQARAEKSEAECVRLRKILAQIGQSVGVYLKEK